MKRADFELQILPRLPPAARKEALRQLGAAPLSEEPTKKSSRQKSVVVKAPVFCSRCGSYEHDKNEPKCALPHIQASIDAFDARRLPKAIFAVPVRTTNEQNGAHGFWAAKAKKRDLVKAALREGWKAAGISLRPRYRVTVTRISHPLADLINLGTCLKSVCDEIAGRMRLDDDSPLIEWKLQRELGQPERPAVRVEVEELP